MSDTMEDRARELMTTNDWINGYCTRVLAAALTAAHQAGVEQERERCANIVWEVTKYMGIHEKQGTLVAELEQAIRSHPQGQPPTKEGGKE